MKRILQTKVSVKIASHLFLVLILISTGFNKVNAQNLLTNGDFESGGSGVGFQIQAPYVVDPTPGNSVPNDYYITNDPWNMNNFFFHSTDHTSGTGKMLVVDGTTTGGQQRFWKAGSNGGGVGPLTAGVTYTFSYWIKSVSPSDTDVNTLADIRIAWNNVANITLVSGSTLAPLPSQGWKQVVYTFTSTYANIELYDNNLNNIGNDFAIDDMSVTAPPTPLTMAYSLINPTCPSGTDGSIVLYGHGGTPPYTYLVDGVSSPSGIVTGLAGSSHTVAITDAASVSVGPVNVVLTSPAGLTVTGATSICAGASATIGVSGGLPPYTWTSSPPDPTLLGQTNSPNPTVSPVVTTTYTVSCVVPTTKNLIYNGDFELGDKGFYTNYNSYSSPPAPSNPTGVQGSYSITTSPVNFESGFIAGGDHTSGTGNMMVADGSILHSGTDTLWYQIIPVITNTSYTFSYWIETVAVPSPPTMDITINGVSLGTYVSPNNTTSGWQHVTYTWNSSASTLAKIAMYDRNVTAVANDFAIDDISFTSAPVNCSLIDSVKIIVNCSLPLHLLNFTGKVVGNESHLQWQTANEINTLEFIIQHSVDGISFTNIGNTPAAGNSSSVLNYSFVDMHPVTGNNYYRLQMIDKDGQVAYSNIVLVKFVNLAPGISIYPNPASGYVVIEHPLSTVTAQIKVIDMLGRIVLKSEVGGGSTKTKIDISRLSGGSYHVIWSDGSINAGKTLLVN